MYTHCVPHLTIIITLYNYTTRHIKHDSCVQLGTRATSVIAVRFGPKVGQICPNGTNLGLFKISFSTFWLGEPKCTEADLKKSQIFSIWGQSDPTYMPNYTSLLQIIYRYFENAVVLHPSVKEQPCWRPLWCRPHCSPVSPWTPPLTLSLATLGLDLCILFLLGQISREVQTFVKF